MGFSLGGTAAPLPRKSDCWIGDIAQAVNTGGSPYVNDFAISGYRNGFSLYVSGSNCAYGAKTLTLVTATGTQDIQSQSYTTAGTPFSFALDFSNGFFYDGTNKGTLTVNIEDVTAIRITFSDVSSSMSGTYHIYEVKLLQLDANITVV